MDVFINLAYIAASILFIFGIKMLGSAVTARRGNRLSAAGMLLAVVATLLDRAIISYTWIIAGIALGALAGAVAARRVRMTGMPELVALFNGFGGLASLLVGWAEHDHLLAVGWNKYETVHPIFTCSVIALAVFIGGVTFSGSVVAFLKLSGKISGKPALYTGQHLVNAAAFLVIAAAMLYFALAPESPHSAIALYALIGLALLLGILGVSPIGGGDMPVVIAFLNSCSGLAAAAAGFVIFNNVLIVAGVLVGASGLVLTTIMCKAMNRSFANVLFGGFGAAPKTGPAAAMDGEMKGVSPEDAYFVLEAAGSVVIVPGYGMAVAQAQHAVKELGELLEANGTEVRYAIHPVAGRMPGHMNVLLAEADVDYDKLCEMDDVNPIMATVDVAIVIGANDVVNPAAAEDPDSPIYGMPIINVHEAKTIFALKRGKGTGFSGLENRLFFRPNCRMIYGDAKSTVSSLAGQFKD
ncbi:MAG TPA: NAD(P)(+) transhydrogenase (Re/Si-specific) subunit beta [Verrucomicrobiales bacterium]|nr:NAD(P)(+) transhydrogenase (Re/Si-specific) subunit beta [Verrucomicrobiales bacterium]